MGKCCLCGKDYGEWGNNALPVKDGRCCDDCNTMKVIPARLALLLADKKETAAEEKK